MVESQLHEADDLHTRYSEPVDEWLAIENDELRQQLEDMELTLVIEHDIMLKAIRDKELADIRAEQIKREWKEKQHDINATLTCKMVVLTDIVKEYEKILSMYVERTSVKLGTNKLDTLLKDGGFKV